MSVEGGNKTKKDLSSSRFRLRKRGELHSDESSYCTKDTENKHSFLDAVLYIEQMKEFSAGASHRVVGTLRHRWGSYRRQYYVRILEYRKDCKKPERGRNSPENPMPVYHWDAFLTGMRPENISPMGDGNLDPRSAYAIGNPFNVVGEQDNRCDA